MLLYADDGQHYGRTYAYIASCKRCGDRKRFEVRDGLAIRCNCQVTNGHARRPRVEPVRGTVKPDHKCDGRCLHAIGGSCECACGGKNHGAGH